MKNLYVLYSTTVSVLASALVFVGQTINLVVCSFATFECL